MPMELVLPLLLVTLLLFAGSLYGLAALGHFPRAARQETLLRGAGPLVLWGSMAAVSVSVTVAAIAAWWFIPWHATVIAGGVAILIAPLVLQWFSDAFVDGRSALICFSAAASGLAIILAFFLCR